MKKIMVICLAQLLLCSYLYAAQIPAGQDAGAAIKRYTVEKQKKNALKRLTTQETEPPAMDGEEAEGLPHGVEIIYISNIIIQQGPLVDDYIEEKEISSLIKRYENKNLSLQDMKQLAAALTDKFTSRNLKAYIPKQSFAGRVMYINLKSNP